MGRAAAGSVLLVVGVATAAYTPSVRPAVVSAARHAPHPQLLAKKPFKGGRLDDFLDAGEAEARYGPRRYAAVADDAWKIQVSQQQTAEARERTKREYAAQKSQMLQDHAFLSLLGVAAMWSLFGLKVVTSYAVGALLGGMYIYLLQRSTDSLGASSIEEVSKLPPPIIVPVLLVLVCAKNTATLGLIPCFAGFATNKLATLYQIAYPEGWGLDRVEGGGTA